jgi:hypothetical protein
MQIWTANKQTLELKMLEKEFKKTARIDDELFILVLINALA